MPSTSHMMWETHPIGPSGRHFRLCGSDPGKQSVHVWALLSSASAVFGPT